MTSPFLSELRKVKGPAIKVNREDDNSAYSVPLSRCTARTLSDLSYARLCLKLRSGFFTYRSSSHVSSEVVERVRRCSCSSQSKDVTTGPDPSLENKSTAGRLVYLCALVEVVNRPT